MRVFTVLALLVAVIWPMGPALAQKVAVDPNTAGTARPFEEEDKPDSRLSRKVTYATSRKPVREILAELSKQTKVGLKAGADDRDWQVRDRRMNVFVKDVPLRDVMDSIARVMKFKWSSSGNGDKRTYRLFTDRKTMQAIEDKLASQREKHDKDLADRRSKMIEDFSKLDKLSPEELAKLKQDSPMEYLVVTTGIGSAMGAFFRETPAAVEALASGSEMSLNGAAMSPAAQNGLMQAVGAMVKLGNSLGDNKLSVPEDMAANMGKVSVQLNRNIDMFKSTPAEKFILGEMSIRYGDKSFDMTIPDPDSKLVKMAAKALIKSQEEGRPIEEIMKGMQVELTAVVLSEMKSGETGDPAVEHADDPALEKEIRMKPEGPRLDQVLQELQKASQYAVVSDSFTYNMSGPQDVQVIQVTTVKDVLTTISDELRYNWERHGSALELRDRDWYKKRAAQIPDAWIESWRKTLKETGTLDLNDLVQMAGLNLEQIEANLSADEDLKRSGANWIPMGNSELLKFWGSLNELQQGLAFSEGGLNLRALSPEQWKSASSLITQKNTEFLQNERSRLLLKVTKTPDGKQFRYKFSVTTSDNLPPLEVVLTTPKYVEPPKEGEGATKPKDKN